MKTINIMNFVRQNDHRLPAHSDILYRTTEAELALVNAYEVENTFLLQYDAFCDERFVKLFREKATPHTELGVWYEIVEPLTSACGLPYRSEKGWKWDWHIVPGFSMAYSPKERECLIDETMRKFKEIFGTYPRTIASWLFDTHTLNYLADHYDISAVAICRDQRNTDAYTLVGGYFNQAYYPSRNNLFTPAQTAAYRIPVPMFRLLGSSPVHNYDDKKYYSPQMAAQHGCATLEPVWYSGAHEACVDWFFKTYFENEDLGFSYAQLGQENSFGEHDLITPLRMQIEKALRLKDVRIEKMCDTGEAFKKAFPEKTPATAVTALDNWDDEDIQSVYYDCQNYVANLFRYEGYTFIRALYLFDERVEEHYLTRTCTTFDAVYENLPLVDTVVGYAQERRECGLVIDTQGEAFTVQKTAEEALTASWTAHTVTFEPDAITVKAPKLYFYAARQPAQIVCEGQALAYRYKGVQYRLRVENAQICPCVNGDFEIIPSEGTCKLYPERDGRQFG